MEIDMLHETPETVAAPGEVGAKPRGDPDDRRRTANLVSLATALGVAVAAGSAVDRATVADYDGQGGGTVGASAAASNSREVGRMAHLRAASMTTSCATSCSRRTRSRLSQAALETLAVIAYKQPISGAPSRRSEP
jgi:type IV secretory pathway VirJ component